MVEEPIDGRSSDGFISQHLRPAGEGLVGREDHGPMLVPCIDYLEEEVGLLLRQRLVPDLVDEHQVRFP